MSMLVRRRAHADLLQALIAYCLIAAITTLIHIYLTMLWLNDVDPVRILSRSRFHRATLTASLTFFDTLSYFTVMACIAGMWLSTREHTFYEKTLCVLVVQLACSATVILAPLIEFGDGKSTRLLRVLCSMTGFILSAGITIEYQATRSRNLLMKDFDCYGRQNTPYHRLQTSTMLHLLLCALFLLEICLTFLLHMVRSVSPNPQANVWNERERFLGWARTNTRRGCSILWNVLVWMSFVSIVIIRQQADLTFGQWYEDNSMGYGQVLACGFCIQAVAQWLVCLVVPVDNVLDTVDGLESADNSPGRAYFMVPDSMPGDSVPWTVDNDVEEG